ncbi:sigma-70 family RNA polymerase sigma factor [Aneurinibacillus tyrosinisolvens]|uniref:sigma-70 family RNA polymerase sigma factor n=1 Tax=Aneurinibacillus tyrosinisolvens TaxID=1443435 RepID=UPI000A40AA4B|nr:sigma-70 family RNA polymerase sigma factor [Aneurinibacillus tyrosinisolvens]
MRDADREEMNKLIDRTIAGDREAFGEIYEKTIDNVSRTVHFLLGDKSSFDDVLQEIYLQIYKSLPGFDRKRPFRPWVTGIAIRQVNSYRRKNWMLFRIAAKKREQEEEKTEPDFSGDVVDRLENEELLRQIESLPYKLKQVVILRYLHDYSQEEVAQILDIPAGTVKSRIHSALQKLRKKQESSIHFFREAGSRYEL